MPRPLAALALWAPASLAAGGLAEDGWSYLRQDWESVTAPARTLQPGPVLPAWKGCADKISKALPYCDMKLSMEERIQWLVKNMTVDEKIHFLGPFTGEACTTTGAGKPSIGLPNYMWLTETNSMVSAACLKDPPYRCTTTFPGPMNMASSFNRTLWRLKGSVIGTEMRAFNNLDWHRRPPFGQVGLHAFGPNINIMRDPRFGRNSELPGEDPFLSGHYAAEMVTGMQEQDEQGHPKVLAHLKHFTAYGMEANRFATNANISMHDLHDTYLAQYEIAFKLGKPNGAMCSYTSINGKPSCANGYILNEMIRKRWGQKDAFITTDCYALTNIGAATKAKVTGEEKAAWALMNGTDLEMGSGEWKTSLKKAIAQGLATEEALNTAFTRALSGQFRAGRFDPPEQLGWSKLGAEDINTTRSREATWEAGLQGSVLLKNEGGFLPLKTGTKIAVVGPRGMSTDLTEDYATVTIAGEGGCWPGSDDKGGCIPTIAEAIARVNGLDATTMAKGVNVSDAHLEGIPAALAIAKDAEVVVLVLGDDYTVEREGQDRPDITLPGIQMSFAQMILALGKPTMLILANGGPIAIDELVNPCRAIVESFDLAQRADALAHLLFGLENRWGKLPVTVYDKNFTREHAMDNYEMAKPPGRTYRYYTGKPLFEFGHGLSYATFALACDRPRTATPAKTGKLSFSCTVKNTGARDGDEVVMVYHSAGDAIRKKADHPVPIKTLIGFERVHVAAGKSEVVHFDLDEDALKLVNKDGEKELYKGEQALVFSTGAGQSVTVQVGVSHANAEPGAAPLVFA